MSLFRSQVHQDIWVGHHCERCYHWPACPILARALRTQRKPVEWDRNLRATLMQDSIRCNEETRKPPTIKHTKTFEDVPMFDVDPPVTMDGNHA